MISDEELLTLKGQEPPPDDAWLSVLLAKEAAQEDPMPVAQSVAQPAPVQSGPGAEELRYLEENGAPGGWRDVLGGAMAGLAETTGSRGALGDFRAQQQARMQQFQGGLDSARTKDRGRGPVDSATMELLQKAGLSPEAAAATTRDSDAFKLLPSLGSLDLRRQGQEQAAQQRAGAVEAQNARSQATIDAQNHRAEDANATRKEIAAMRKTGSGPAAPLTPEQKTKRETALASYLSLQTNVPPDQAKAFVAGQTEGIPPEAAAKLQQFASIYSQLPAKEQAKLLADTSKREAATPDRAQAQVDAKRRDPNKRLEYRREIDESGATIAAASRAWAAMSPEGKKALATLDGNGWASRNLRDLMTSDQDKVAAAKIQALANRLIKETSGAAVSDSEWNRLATQMGLASTSFDLLKTPSAIESWLGSAKSAWVRNKRAVQSEFGDLWGGER